MCCFAVLLMVFCLLSVCCVDSRALRSPLSPGSMSLSCLSKGSGRRYGTGRSRSMQRTMRITRYAHPPGASRAPIFACLFAFPSSFLAERKIYRKNMYHTIYHACGVVLRTRIIPGTYDTRVRVCRSPFSCSGYFCFCIFQPKIICR